VRRHVVFVGITFSLGVAATALAWATSSARIRAWAGALIAVLAFAQTGWLCRHHNPVCEDRFFHPRTRALADLQESVGGETLLVFGAETLPPELNIENRLRMINGYDARSIHRFDELDRRIFGGDDNWRTALRGTESGLRTVGVKWVLSKSPWIPVETPLNDLLPLADS